MHTDHHKNIANMLGPSFSLTNCPHIIAAYWNSLAMYYESAEAHRKYGGKDAKSYASKLCQDGAKGYASKLFVT